MKRFNLVAVALMAAVLGISPVVSAKNLSTYQELTDALRQGAVVNAVIDVDKCHYLKGSNDWNEKTRSMRFDDIYERVAKTADNSKKMRLVAAVKNDYQGDKSGVFVERSLVRIFEDGQVEVIDQEFDLAGAKVVDEKIMLCALSESGGVVLVPSRVG